MLHLTIAGCDYSAYGCLFLLKHPERRQVFCHCLARRFQLTDEEWQKATASWDTIRAFEKHAREHKLGHFDRDWYRSNNPSCITAVCRLSTDGKGEDGDGKKNIPADSLYAKFHNLNAMAAELCRDSIKMSIDRKTLTECKKEECKKENASGQ